MWFAKLDGGATNHRFKKNATNTRIKNILHPKPIGFAGLNSDAANPLGLTTFHLCIRGY